MCKLGTRPCANTLNHSSSSLIGAVYAHKVTSLTRTQHGFQLGSRYNAAAPFDLEANKWSPQLFLRTPTDTKLWAEQAYVWSCAEFQTGNINLNKSYSSRLVWESLWPYRVKTSKIKDVEIVCVYTSVDSVNAVDSIDVPKPCNRRLTCKGKLYCWCSSPFICRCESR